MEISSFNNRFPKLTSKYKISNVDYIFFKKILSIHHTMELLLLKLLVNWIDNYKSVVGGKWVRLGIYLPGTDSNDEIRLERGVLFRLQKPRTLERAWYSHPIPRSMDGHSPRCRRKHHFGADLTPCSQWGHFSLDWASLLITHSCGCLSLRGH